ncbi:MAG: alpha/beta hydrolase [Gemmatales bacterium]
MWWLLLLIPALFIVGYFRDVKRIGTAKARRSLILHFTGLGFLYCLVLIVLVSFENQLLFQPISFADLHEDTSSLKYEEFSFPSSDGNTLVGWWCPQEGADWTILYCHGTGGNLSLHTMIVPMMQKTSKVNVLAFGYPGYSGSTGSPSEEGCYTSAQAAYDWLTTAKKIDPKRLIIFGQSMGGGVACNLALQKPHAGLILLSTFTTLPERAQEVIPIFPINWLMKNRFDNRSKISKYQGPLLIAHGDNDDVVPFHHGEELFAVAASPHKEFCHIPGGTHVVFNQEFFRTVAKMMASLP